MLEAGRGGGQTCFALPPLTSSVTRFSGQAFCLLSQGSAARVEPVSPWESLETTAVYQEGFPEMWSLDGEGELYRFMAFGVCFCSPNWKHTGASAAAHLAPDCPVPPRAWLPLPDPHTLAASCQDGLPEAA